MTVEELQEKVIVYEQILHDIQLYSNVTMDTKRLQKLISVVNSWSYAHRCGNGELSDEEQDRLIRFEYERLKTKEYARLD